MNPYDPALCLATFLALGSASGWAGENRQAKIVGGEVAASQEFGFAAALLTHAVSNAFDAQFCGGALIHPYWVATAAHCVEGTYADEVDVLIGTSNLNLTAGAQRLRVAAIFRHPDYRDDEGTLDNDVALLLLAAPASAGTPLLPLINDTRLAEPGISATAIGWGNTTSTGSPSAVLRKVVLPLLSNDTANQPGWLNQEITPTMITAGLPTGGRDSCQGDSGGPLLVRGHGGVGWNLAGIVSWGDGCAEPQHPGVYARVSRFRQWMQGFVWPQYTEWELQHGVETESPPDADSDGLVQWLEYLMDTHPLQASSASPPVPGIARLGNLPYATLSFRQRLGPANGSLEVSRSDSLSTWTALSPTTGSSMETVPLSGEPGVGLTTVTPPSPVAEGSRQFLRLSAVPSPLFQDFPRSLAPGETAHSRLNPYDPLRDGSHWQEYRVEGLPAGTLISGIAESTEFRPKIQVLHPTNGTQLTAAAAGGNTLAFSFTAPAEGACLVRLSSTVPAASGYYGLRVGADPAPLYPQLAIPGIYTGQLTNSDEVDPDFLPDFYRYDLYEIVGTTAGRLCRIFMNSSQVDANLYLLDNGGNVIAEDDDSGTGTNSRLDFTPLPGRTYRIFASTALPDETGSYTLVLSVF